jgi:hypothetical protein
MAMGSFSARRTRMNLRQFRGEDLESSKKTRETI